jgi:putative flippase GtrA
MNPSLIKLARYLISGGIAASVDLGSLYLFVSLMHLWYLLATTLSFILTLVVSFVLQKWWTFKDSSTASLPRQASSYLALSVVNVFVNAGLMYVLVHTLGMQYLVAQFLVIGVIALYGFFLYRYWIFRAP